MDFQKIRKNKQLTPSPKSSSHDQPGGRSNRTPPRAQASSSQPIVNRFLGTMFINSMSIRPLAFPNHYLYNLLPLDTSPRAPPQGNTIRRSEEVPRAVKLTKNKPRKSMKVKKNKNKKIKNK